MTNLKESKNIEDRRGKATPEENCWAIVILAEAFYRSYYRRGASKVRSSSSFFWFFSRRWWRLTLGRYLWKWDFSNFLQSSQHAHQQDPCRRCRCDLSTVLGTTEDHWHGLSSRRDALTMASPKLVFYTGQLQTGCGVGRSICWSPLSDRPDLFGYELPGDNQKHKASRGLCHGYVIAPRSHGHHVQNRLGILGNTIGCNKVFLKRTMCSSVASSYKPDLAGVWATLHSRPKPSRYQQYPKEAMNATLQ